MNLFVELTFRTPTTETSMLVTPRDLCLKITGLHKDSLGLVNKYLTPNKRDENVNVSLHFIDGPTSSPK